MYFTTPFNEYTPGQLCRAAFESFQSLYYHWGLKWNTHTKKTPKMCLLNILFKNFAWIIRGWKNFKNFAETNFRGLAKNPWKLILRQLISLRYFFCEKSFLKDQFLYVLKQRITCDFYIFYCIYSLLDFLYMSTESFFTHLFWTKTAHEVVMKNNLKTDLWNISVSVLISANFEPNFEINYAFLFYKQLQFLPSG